MWRFGATKSTSRVEALSNYNTSKTAIDLEPDCHDFGKATLIT